MSFWPRLRKRSRGRKRSSTASGAKTTNAYASGENDTYKVVHEEFKAERAQFASERGVSVELVRFLSRSSRGWVHLPCESPSGASSPRASEDVSVTFPSLTPQVSDKFSLPVSAVPAVPLPDDGTCAAAESGDMEGGGGQQGVESLSVESVVMGLDLKGEARNVGRLVVSRKLKDEAWLQISKTAAVLYVKVLFFSRALGASTAFAFTVAVVVDIWNRGKGSLHRVFSALASQLLTTLKPYLSLQLRKPAATLIRAAPRPAPQLSDPEQFPEQLSASIAMKVSPVTEDSTNAQDFRSSSFAFPVVSKEPSSASPRFSVRQRQADSLHVRSTPEETSPLPSPLVESNKQPSTRPCHKLKSKLFKCSPARKGENSSPSAEISKTDDGPSSSASSGNVSPAHGKSCKSKASCISGTPINGSEEEYGEVDQPTSSLKPPKRITRSHELLFFRSPNINRKRETTASRECAGSSAGVKNLSRSQELKLSLKNLGRKKVSRSQEFTTSSPPLPLQDFALPKSTVEGLEALAFPFKANERVQGHERPSLPGSPRQDSSTRRKSGLSKPRSVEPLYEQYNSTGLESPRSSTVSSSGSRKGGKSKTTAASSSSCLRSSKVFAMLAADELQPKLRKVRTTVSPPPGSDHQALGRVKSSVIQSHNKPSHTGELGRSQVFGREILASILLLVILACLLLGRIPAILCTSCLCLVLPHLQRFFHKKLTPKDTEVLKRNSGISRPQNASSSPLSNGTLSNHGSPLHEKFGLQSSEYRKRVLIEGLLDRGNRRGATS